MQNQTKELTEKQPLTPELAREFDALVPLMQRLYDVLKPHSWDKEHYLNIDLNLCGFDSVTVSLSAYANGATIYAGTVDDLFKKVLEFDPVSVKRSRLSEIEAERAKLQAELAEVV